MSVYIDAINQAANVTATSNNDNQNDENVMGKDDFLMLLVAQLQNQDPLNPDEPTEFTAQLAQFSSLEQLFTLNDSMEALVSANQSSDRMSTLSTIGKEIAFKTDSLEYSGSEIEVGYQLSAEATEVSLLIQQNGVTKATLEATELSTGNHYVTWDGMTDSGEQASAGEYTIVVQAKGAGEEPIVAESLIKAEVTGVDLSGENGGTLITAAAEVSFNSILGVYDPTEKTKSETTEEEQGSLTDNVEESIETVAQVTDDTGQITE